MQSSMEFEVARMDPLFASKEEYEDFSERQSQYNVVTGDLATYEGNCFLGIDAGSTTTKLPWSAKTVPCFILSTATTTEAR